MKSILVFSLSLALFAIANAAQAQMKVAAEPWQKQSLTGLNTLRYGIAYDPTGAMAKQVAAALTNLKVRTKPVDLRNDSKVLLNDHEGRLKVYVDEKREEGKNWVGISLEQKARLSRLGAVTFDTVTYKVGTLCPTASTDTALKELLAEFVKDFQGGGKP